MSYSLDFRKQVQKILDNAMTFAQAAEFYNLSTTTRQTKPYKIPDDVLLNEVKKYSDDYQYKHAHRLNFSRTGIYHALKRLGISQKKYLSASKSLPSKKGQVFKQAQRIHCSRLCYCINE